MNDPSNHFEDLIAWKYSMELVEVIYHHTNNFPVSEQFGLTNQLRRATVSILSNLAEGSSRFSRKEKARLYEIAFGSANEVKAQLLICKRLKILEPNVVNEILGITQTVIKK